MNYGIGLQISNRKDSVDKEYLELQQELEAEAGGKIINQAVVSIRTGTTVNELQDGLFGLLAFTDSVLVFKHYPQNSWISMLTRGNSRKLETKEVTLIIPMESIEELDRFAETTFLRKLFLNPDPVYTISFRDNHNLRQTLIINLGFCKSGEKTYYKMLTESLSTGG